MIYHSLPYRDVSTAFQYPIPVQKDSLSQLVSGSSSSVFQANAIVNSLQASVYKVQRALAELNGDSKPSDWLINYVESSRDKQVTNQHVYLLCVI